MCVRFASCVGHINAEDVDCVVIGRCCDISRMVTEVQIIDLGFVGATSENKGASWIGRIHLPNADESAFFTGSCQKVTMSIEGYSCD